MESYEKLLNRYARAGVVTQKVEDEKLSKFYVEWSFKKFMLPNYQILDFEGLLGRVCSASYMPRPEEPSFALMKTELREMFEKYQRNNQIALYYETNLFLGTLL